MKKILTLTLVMLMMALSVVPAFAANYTPVTGTSTTFAVDFVMDQTDKVPNATFAFTIAPGTAITADVSEGQMEVLAGVGSPSVSSVTFSHSDTTASNGSGRYVVSHPATVSFSGVTFPEPGIYRYVITQTASSDHANAGIIHDSAPTRILDVYVTDDNTGLETGLQISSYVLHTDASTIDMGANMGSDVDATLADKSAGYINQYNSKDLQTSLGVTGNQASRDKYFAVTVQVTGINSSDNYNVSGATGAITTNSATTVGEQSNPTLVTGAQLLAGKTFYLQHGQNIVIHGIAPNATYTVTEAPEDYASAVMTGKINTGVIGTIAGANKTAQAGFTNTRDGIIPTGVMVSVASGVTLAVIALLALLVLGRKKAEDEE